MQLHDLDGEVNRRAFLAALAAVAVAPAAPPIAMDSRSTPVLTLHPDAFASVMRPLTRDEQFSCEFDWPQAEGPRS